MRDRAARIVAQNWTMHKRFPRLLAHAHTLGYFATPGYCWEHPSPVHGF